MFLHGTGAASGGWCRVSAIGSEPVLMHPSRAVAL
jgi:hypothetical protein